MSAGGGNAKPNGAIASPRQRFSRRGDIPAADVLGTANARCGQHNRRALIHNSAGRNEAMNWTEMHSDWDECAPTLATWWPKLTEADLQQIAGSRGKLAEVLSERYGIDAAEADRQICAYEKEVRRPGAVK
jgi:hypothetical protein